MNVAPQIVSTRVVKTRIGAAPSTGNSTSAPCTLADPVLLLHEHGLRPRRELLHVLEELVLVGGDTEEPLLHVALLDRALAAPAEPALGLLVREHGEAGRAPVDGRLGAVRDPALEHAKEEPLVPAVVRRVAGGDLAAPRVTEPEPPQLPLHPRDVLARPGLGMDAALDGRVLRGEPESVPADRVHHVEPAHGLAARDHVGDAVVAHVADVDVAGGVRKHLEAVVLRPRGVVGHLEGARLVPPLLPAGLDRLKSSSLMVILIVRRQAVWRAGRGRRPRRRTDGRRSRRAAPASPVGRAWRNNATSAATPGDVLAAPAMADPSRADGRQGPGRRSQAVPCSP